MGITQQRLNDDGERLVGLEVLDDSMAGIEYFRGQKLICDRGATMQSVTNGSGVIVSIAGKPGGLIMCRVRAINNGVVSLDAGGSAGETIYPTDKVKLWAKIVYIFSPQP